ncbi:hypothetical protein PTTG_09065 [Puccinia triticina 1-1 BBBD Race 1]|uniref:L-ornithine N(5)-monooxygenase n=2 Tax=Puccinia triticina TaxID=208348 RepID=A0A180G8K6_PUCT1|nr:uncharacterized protein PtA15_1A361 [Puccinia triticina]OAV88954.1 hypothetical protein PTTG_09065 [Puccinia triticina 1-1 BBBD Race 1]WAQ81023.1 hypothetical protein PtA15_1A361 [Puccinia triticina]WAR51911.1 hypothetical protein PtB15_1B348 [Puccinia triticina]
MCSPQTVYLHESIETIDPEDFFDVLIIGAGPHALGLAARLREPRPAALYTDIEHSRLAFLQRPDAVKLPRQPKKPYNLRAPNPIKLREQAGNHFDDDSFPRLLALDGSSPEWLGRWNGFFHHLDIPHLRSPMFFHPSPADVDGLEAFARRMDREKECVDSGGVEDVLPTVGQSKRGGDKIRKRATRKKGCLKSSLGAEINERDRSSYARPSSGVFRDFCKKELVERYQLDPVLRQETVESLSFGDLHIRTEGRGRGFRVMTKEGKRYGAKFVVMSIGGQECPAIPKCISECTAQLESLTAKRHDSHQGPGWCHSRCFSYGGTKEFKQAIKASKSTNQGTILVIGGGLTSAQIADLAIRKGAARVILVCRGYLKTKHYDFPLSWVTKYSNLEKMSFWQEDCPMARLKMVRQARNGGSVNPSTLLLLKKRIAEGTLSLRTHTTVTQAMWDKNTGRWTVHLVHHPEKAADPVEKPKPEILEDVTFIVASTGGKLDFGSIPFLSPLLHPEHDQGKQDDHPSNKKTANVPGIIEGLPLLTEDLQWGKELPLFVMGAYAALELGPDAANLSGSRGGAERIGSKSTSKPILSPEPPADSSPEIESTLKESEVPTAVKGVIEHHMPDIFPEKPPSCSTKRGRCAFKMGARERRAGNVGGWYAGLEEVVL